MRNDLDRLDLLAAGHVLGTLDAAERREAQARLEREESFACLVEAWSERLAPLVEALAPVEPPAGLWRRIEAALWPKPAVALPQIGLERPRRPVSAWRWSALAAAAIAIYVAATTPEQPRGGRYMALLESGPSQAAWAVALDLSEGTLSARPLGRPAAVEGSRELWLIPGGGGAPRSLGLLSPGESRPAAVIAALRPAVLRDAALAVSLEPAGGSPTGQPTGPVLYQGRLLDLAD